MNFELQNLTWACLPKEARKEIYDHYIGLNAALDCFLKKESLSNKECDRVEVIREKKAIYEMYFGKHNLTSNIEPEEMLHAKRSDVQRWFAGLSELYHICDKELMCIKDLFGDKCRSDEDLIKEQTEFQERILCNPDRPTDEEIWRDITGEIPLHHP